MPTKDVLSIMLVSGILIALAGSLLGRLLQKKGIGWQFIRFNTIISAVLLAAMLTLNDMLREGVIAVLSGAMGFAFGKQEKEDA